MTQTTPTRDERHVRLYTNGGPVEGSLQTSSTLRTIDDLNLVARNFVTLQSANASGLDWMTSSGRLALSKSLILFVVELADYPATSRRIEAGRYRRAPLRLRVEGYDVQGFLHVPLGGDPMSRLNQDSHDFIALTSASIVGPDCRLAVPFLAVNRRHIRFAQELIAEEVDEPAEPVGASEG